MMDRIHDREPVRGMVPLSLAQVLQDYLTAQGADAGRIWPQGPSLKHALEAGAAPGQALIGRSLGRFPAETFCQWLIRAAEYLGDPLLGLHLGQTIRPDHLGVLGYALLACDNLGAALARIERYHRLIHDINPMRHHLRADGLELQWGTLMGRPGALFDETGITAIVQFGRDLCGRELPVLQLDFVNPPPPDIRPFEAYFGCEVRFSQPLTRLRLPLESLMLPLRRPDPHLLSLMEIQVEQVMASLPRHDGDLADMTCRAIALLAPQGTPELETVASELKISPRMLYRRLLQQGLNFRRLREQTLCRLAELHLADPRLTLVDVALLLGYSEQSAFTRAFKRWTGKAPLQWRQGRTRESASQLRPAGCEA